MWRKEDEFPMWGVWGVLKKKLTVGLGGEFDNINHNMGCQQALYLIVVGMKIRRVIIIYVEG